MILSQVERPPLRCFSTIGFQMRRARVSRDGDPRVPRPRLTCVRRFTSPLERKIARCGYYRLNISVAIPLFAGAVKVNTLARGAGIEREDAMEIQYRKRLNASPFG